MFPKISPDWNPDQNLRMTEVGCYIIIPYPSESPPVFKLSTNLTLEEAGWREATVVDVLDNIEQARQVLTDYIKSDGKQPDPVTLTYIKKWTVARLQVRDHRSIKGQIT